VHYGSEPTELSNTIRTAINACYTPAKLASMETMEIKEKVFGAWSGTTHWPHDNVRERKNETFFEDGTRDPKDRDEPREVPVLSDELMKLAGVMTY
jgi:hypothetical protein